MHRLDRLFEQFLRERTYVQNVTASTCEWYESAWKAFKRAHANPPDRAPNAALISKADLQHFVVHEREPVASPFENRPKNQGKSSVVVSGRFVKSPYEPGGRTVESCRPHERPQIASDTCQDEVVGGCAATAICLKLDSHQDRYR